MVTSKDAVRAEIGAALDGVGRGLPSANRLCDVCVELFEVDGAAISLVMDGASRGTYGSSGPLSRRLDELQFTFGEGPCLDAVSEQRPVFAADLSARDERRWPAFAGAVLETGVHAVFAFPVTIDAAYVGALDLFRHVPGSLTAADATGGRVAADFATLPLLDLIDATRGGGTERELAAEDTRWERLESLDRVEVYQATGMLIAQLDVSADEALIRLRAHAFVTGQSASDVARAIVERRLTLEPDDIARPPTDGSTELPS